MRASVILAVTSASTIAVADGCSDVAEGSHVDLDASFDAPDDAKKVPPPQVDSSVTPIVGPDKLSETGLYSDFASRTISAGIIAYAPRYELWSDGASKKRWLYLPPNSQIDTSNMGGWLFPVGTKAWKEFTFGGEVIETRFLWKARVDAWFEVAYVWAPDGSDAYAQPNGVKNALDAGPDVPNQTQCNDCHFNVTDTLIGVSALQLSNGGNGLLTTFASQGKLTVNPGTEYDVPGDGGVKAALTYLHANCGHCHNDTSHLNLQTTLHLDVEPDDTTIDTTATHRRCTSS